MKKYLKTFISIFLTVMITATLIIPVTAANEIVTTPTGYTSASDVVYQYHTSKNYISNWGARGDVCTFLSPNAQAFYNGNYTYDVLSDNQGGTSQSTAPSSALYKALQKMMKAEHSYIIGYQATRDLYKYTDCLLNDVAHISSFYSGRELSGQWDSGTTWNREHTWPNSKGLGGSDEDDIMMLRPTWKQENSSRGNTAYGEGSSYYDPGKSVRGDCARIVLYVYVRWGNTSRMWGTSGVMENMDVLLKWMEEDPVDTWEMGRNDSVESITGTRNVFVDYPEYAWLLFGEEIPEDMTTPSGIAKKEEDTPVETECTHANTRTEGKKTATCTEPGYTGDVYCKACNQKVKTGTAIKETGHQNTQLQGVKEPTCTEPGYTGDTYCKDCNKTIKNGTAIKEGEHKNIKLQGLKDATCTDNGYDGDYICEDCGATVQEGRPIIAPGSHTFGDWVVIEEATATTDGIQERSCSKCEYKETEKISATDIEETPEPETTEKIEDETKESEVPNMDSATTEEDSSEKEEPDSKWPVGVAIAIPGGCALGVGLLVLLKRRKH